MQESESSGKKLGLGTLMDVAAILNFEKLISKQNAISNFTFSTFGSVLEDKESEQSTPLSGECGRALDNRAEWSVGHGGHSEITQCQEWTRLKGLLNQTRPGLTILRNSSSIDRT